MYADAALICENCPGDPGDEREDLGLPRAGEVGIAAEVAAVIEKKVLNKEGSFSRMAVFQQRVRFFCFEMDLWHN